MNKEEIIQCLKAVITYDKGEGVPIVQYDNQFLLDKEDIETLLDYINQLEDKLNKINTIVSKIDEKKIPKYQNKIRDIKFCLEYDLWANQKVKCANDMSPEELEIHNILLSEIKKEGGSNG